MGFPSRWAETAVVRQVSKRLSCWRQVALAVRIVATQVVPASLSAPKQPVRRRPAGRTARSAAVLVGSTPSTVTNVHRASGGCVQPAVQIEEDGRVRGEGEVPALRGCGDPRHEGVRAEPRVRGVEAPDPPEDALPQSRPERLTGLDLPLRADRLEGPHISKLSPGAK